MIPNFEPTGNLPPGIHECTLKELRDRFGVNPNRLLLMAGLEQAVQALKAAGCQKLYLDGSFVTSKDDPQDFDGCWSVDGVDDAVLDPVLLDFSYQRFFQKLKYRGELFPAEIAESVTGKTWIDFFQVDRDTGQPKGILLVRIDQESL